MRFLIVEDDPDGADVLDLMLESVGLETRVVNSAEHALYELQNNPTTYDAAIVDLALPEMDGFELLGRLRDTPDLRHMVLVAVTAYHTPELKFKALEAGFDAYFAKPLDTTLFVQALERLFAN